ncbi:MAG: methionine--tRNA ligase [Prevotellaceae bacterium]|jgi:methionyl-tRNA synthetase|nr:methionine--tRNA ligase [Prevotellaceae bacterium]
MKPTPKRYLVTSALPYANGPVHIGHLAGVYVPADIYTRYLRLRGRDVVFVGGSDEHGVPITIKARQQGCTPQQVVDKYHEMIRKSFADFGISFDVYSRTSSKIHHKTAADFFRKLYDEGKFTEKTSEQYYDEEAGQFLADRYIVGGCPHCGNEKAYGDQCEKCGSTLSPTELVNPHSAISGSKPVMRETSHWYLPLNEYEEWLKQWILEEHREWKPNVYGQCKSWLDNGLQPRAVSRDLDWGVQVPVEGANGKVLYVWFDAPIGYISNTIELLPNDWEKYWKSEDSKMVHFIGKDNIVFHCIVFPCMLKAHGGFVLPDNVPANEFLNLENDKISTTRGWAVWLHEYLEDFPGKQDVLRYVLCANAPETKDNNFTWRDFQDRNNSELVAILGNFVNRAMVLTQKYFEGRVPQPDALTDIDRVALADMLQVKGKVEDNLENFRFREALREAMNLARTGNKYLADTEPWKAIKTDPKRVQTILNVALQISASLAVVMEPFIPFTAQKLRSILNADGAALPWDALGSETLLPAGHQLGEPALLFDKIEDDAIATQLQKLEEMKRASDGQAYRAEPQKELCSFDDFQKMDLRIVKILEAEKLPKSKKLIKMLVDTGIDKRTVLSGVAEHFDPQALVGRQVAMLINLAPRPIMGVESHGMILYAEGSDGKLLLLQPSGEVKNGAKVS